MKKILIYTIMIGVIGLALNTLMGAGTFAFMQKVPITNGLYAYKIDFFSYIANIRDSFTDISRLGLEEIPIEWNNLQGTNITDAEFWAGLVNDLAYILDIIIFGLNIIIYPFRIGAYLLINMLSFIGIKTAGEPTGGMAWLVKLCRFLQQVQIPMVGNT